MPEDRITAGMTSTHPTVHKGPPYGQSRLAKFCLAHLFDGRGEHGVRAFSRAGATSYATTGHLPIVR